MSRFIKFIPSEESSYLRENHPNAFLLLSLIAERARRVAGKPDGLEIGEAHIGDYKKAGIESRQKYRTALEILEIRGHVKKVETCRNRKKSTTGTTTEGTKVKILKSDVWDINCVDDNHINNHRATTGQPPSNHEEERTRKNKKEKETTTPLPPKGENVVVFYDCLKENNDLNEDEKKCLIRFEEKRVKLALDFVKVDKPKTTLIQALYWHCSQKIPPRPTGRRYTDQQRMAIDFNAYLLSIGQELLYHENIKNIENGAYILVPLFGQAQSISLSIDIPTLRKDFEEVKSQQLKRKFG